MEHPLLRCVARARVVGRMYRRPEYRCARRKTDFHAAAASSAFRIVAFPQPTAFLNCALFAVVLPLQHLHAACWARFFPLSCPLRRRHQQHEKVPPTTATLLQAKRFIETKRKKPNECIILKTTNLGGISRHASLFRSRRALKQSCFLFTTLLASALCAVVLAARIAACS